MVHAYSRHCGHFCSVSHDDCGDIMRKGVGLLNLGANLIPIEEEEEEEEDEEEEEEVEEEEEEEEDNAPGR